MSVEKQSHVLNAFDLFLNRCINNQKELITKGDDVIFTTDKIKKCFELVNNADNKDIIDLFGNGDHQSLLLHCYWLMNFFGDNSAKRPEVDASIYRDYYGEEKTVLFPSEIICSTGQTYSGTGLKKPLLFILALLYQVQKENVGKEPNNDISTLKKTIIDNINIQGRNKTVKSIDSENTIECSSIANILLHLCAPKDYVPIIAQGNKDVIFKYLGFLDNQKEYDEKSFVKIEKELSDKTGKSFYDKSIIPFWNIPQIGTNVNKDDELGVDTLLRFKKAIVLYGPPGTGKTYTARTLAKNLICSCFAQYLKGVEQSKKVEVFKEFIEGEDTIYDNHIHRLQMHPNYTYDDFIVGKTITDKGIDVQEGYLLRLIDKIKKDREKNNNQEINFWKLPHIVILDEINRVDISRVFGELFTAMESDYRDSGCDLPVTKDNKQLKLIVPHDLYFIGTMNQIDFSLEQIDFALRRRFAWVESTFNKAKLKEIIEDKLEAKGLKTNDFDVNNYADLCQKVNDFIGKEPSLGKKYWIGHAFFTEIVDIYMEAPKKNWDEAQKLLWYISIKPTLDAYCGTMDEKATNEFIRKCFNVFIPPKTNNTQSSNLQEGKKQEVANSVDE